MEQGLQGQGRGRGKLKKPRLYLEEWGLLCLLNPKTEGKEREELFKLLKGHLKDQGSLCSSVHSFQMLLRICHGLAIGPIETMKALLKEFEDIFEVILPVRQRELQEALLLQEKYQLALEEALHLSLLRGEGIEIMLGPQKPYASLSVDSFIPLPFPNK